MSDPFVPGVTAIGEPPDMDVENQTQALLKSNKHSYLSSPKFIYFLFLCICFAYMYVCAACACLIPEEAGEGIGSPLSDITDAMSSQVSTGNPSGTFKLLCLELGILNL